MSNNIAILNLTQHNATPEQIAQGVVEVHELDKEDVRWNLTFNTLEECSIEEMERRAQDLATMASFRGVSYAMIGGAPFFMPVLEKALREVGITPVYAFSVRESVEQSQPDGSVRKVNVFKHVGFVGL